METSTSKLNIIITGDGLYSKQPFVDELKKAGMSDILVAKPIDQKILFEWVEELTGLGDGKTLEINEGKGKRYVHDGKLKMKRLTPSRIKDIILNIIMAFPRRGLACFIVLLIKIRVVEQTKSAIRQT